MIGIRTSHFVIIGIATVLIGSALFILQGCKLMFPFSCSNDTDCDKERAYCHQEACINSTCKDDLECLGGRKCFNSKCEVPKTCDKDIDCDSNATCVDNDGSSICKCNEGYFGNGAPDACDRACESGQMRCDPSSSSKMQTCGDDGLWGEAVDCLAGQLCGAVSTNSCGSCNSDQQCVDAAIYGSGFICVKGSCVEGNCHGDGDCKVPGQTCDGGGKASFCGGCTNPTDKEFCGEKNCGTVTGFDYCENSRTVNCGECFGAQTCGGAGTQNVCGCPPPPHAPTETATWPEISDKKLIPDLAYDFTSIPGQVIDKQTCLFWKRYPLGDSDKKEWKRYTWEEAMKACSDIGSEWRLPTRVELGSIMDPYKRKESIKPTININAFPNTPSGLFWTSSERDSGSAWLVFFSNGYSYWRYKAGNSYYAVRCVR